VSGADGWRYVLDESVAEQVLAMSYSRREVLIRLFRELVNNPYEPGDRAFLDSIGRQIQEKTFGAWHICFWPDHSVKEMRIVSVQPVGASR